MLCVNQTSIISSHKSAIKFHNKVIEAVPSAPCYGNITSAMALQGANIKQSDFPSPRKDFDHRKEGKITKFTGVHIKSFWVWPNGMGMQRRKRA